LAQETSSEKSDIAGLPDRQAGEDFLDLELTTIVEPHRQDNPALLMFDIDGLTAINNKYGRKVGDLVIHELDKLLTRQKGLSYKGRCGDDTFYAVIDRRNSRRNRGESIAAELHERIRRHRWARLAPGLYVTISSGIAWLGRSEEVRNWVIRACCGMLDAKHRGRNTISLAPLTISIQASRERPDYYS